MKIQELLNHLLEKECLEDLFTIYEDNDLIQNLISRSEFQVICQKSL